MDRENECNSCYVYCNAKGWFQKSHETFKTIWKRGLKLEWWKKEKMDSHKKTWSRNDFLLYKDYITFLMWGFWRSFISFLDTYIFSHFSLFSFFLLCLFVWGWTQVLFENIRGQNKLQTFFGWGEKGYTMNMKMATPDEKWGPDEPSVSPLPARRYSYMDGASVGASQQDNTEWLLPSVMMDMLKLPAAAFTLVQSRLSPNAAR
jgi:hypothetical protein